MNPLLESIFMLWSTSQPSGQRVIDKVRWAKEILEKYGGYIEPESNCD